MRPFGPLREADDTIRAAIVVVVVVVQGSLVAVVVHGAAVVGRARYEFDRTNVGGRAAVTTKNGSARRLPNDRNGIDELLPDGRSAGYPRYVAIRNGNADKNRNQTSRDRTGRGVGRWTRNETDRPTATGKFIDFPNTATNVRSLTDNIDVRHRDNSEVRF